MSQHFEINAVMISKWKADFLENMAVVFQKESSISDTSDSVDVEKLYAQIGQLKVENDFLKKSAKRLGIPENEWKSSK